MKLKLTLVVLIMIGVVGGVAAVASKTNDRSASGPDQDVEVRACNLPSFEGDVSAWLPSVNLMNYAPASQAQSNMWGNWQPDVIDRDFARIASLHANVVRLFVYTPVSGYPEASREYKRKLAEAIEIADQHCLRVQLTLFAFFNNYDDVEGSKRWAASILPDYVDDQRIAFVELQNEIDTTNARAMAWAQKLVPYLETQTRRPITLSVPGWQGVEGLQRLKAAGLDLDFYDLHYYGKPELAYETMRRAQEMAGTRPLFVGETGYSSLPRQHHTFDNNWWYCYQSYYLRSLNVAARKLQLAPPAPWTFNDFASGSFPSGSKSGAEISEYEYGLVRRDGTPKPAALLIEAAFSGMPLDSGTNDSFESGVELPDCWLLWQEELADFALDRDVAHTGRASIRISGSSSTAAGLPAVYQTPPEPIEPGLAYTARVWALGQIASGRNQIGLAWFDADSRFIGNTLSALLPLGRPEWLQLEVQAIAPSKAAYVQVHLISADNKGTVWFDDVSFQ